ncbi:MAG: hypothetical protein D6707_10540, partial [Bacteroidetes bacterium]
VKRLPIDKKYGIGLFDLALLPLIDGYAVDLYAWDAQHFPIVWRNMNQKSLQAVLKKSRPKKGSWRNALRDAYKHGARFFPHPITVDEIKKRLKGGQQLILYIDSAVLYKHANGVWGHYVVLQKISSRTWTIFDPHWKYGGLKKYPKDLILFAFYSVGGYCMFIYPKKRDHLKQQTSPVIVRHTLLGRGGSTYFAGANNSEKFKHL